MEITALDAADFYRVLDERQEPSVVYFTTPGCGACRRLSQVLRDGELNIGHVRIFEVQAEQAYGVLEDLDVFHLPALFLYAQGDCVGPIHAPLQLAAIERVIRQLL